jgi:biopolymer transport protein ExbD
MKPPPNLEVMPVAAVALVLVLIMMVISPLVVSRNSTPVDLPQTHSSERKVESSINISYTKDGRLLLDDEPIASLSELGDSIVKQVKKDPYIMIVVRADTTVMTWQVLDILSTVRRAGGLRIVAGTKKFKEG